MPLLSESPDGEPAAETDTVAVLRLLINDPAAEDALFSDSELQSFLALEGGNVKRAAAQAIDTIADNEALVSKVIRDQDYSADGAKVAETLRKRAAALRAQADADDEAADEGFFQLVPGHQAYRPELTGGMPSTLGYWG